MNDNNENKTENNEDELCIIYKKGTLSSHYLGKLLEGPGTHIRKSIVNGDIVIEPLGEYLMMFSLKTNIEKIIHYLSREIGNDDEPKPLQNKEKKDRPYKMTF
jgi:hypothetical protein